MWDFLASVFPWLQKKLGKQLNRILITIAILACGWYIKVGFDTATNVFNKCNALDKTLSLVTTELGQMHGQVDAIQEIQGKMQITQTSTALEVRKVSVQVDTLQAVVVNRLNLILPPIGITTSQLEYSLCSSR
jgi:hypothetical protein